MLTSEQINELHRLEDDALLDTHEAAAFLNYRPSSLNWLRSNQPERSPRFVKVGGRSVRYRVGDLRAFAAARGA